jgi:hypothetical protein
MKSKIFAWLLVIAFILGVVGLGLAETNEKSAKANSLAMLLPSSDAALTFDSKRFFGEALPQILSGNQPLLGEVLAKVDEIKNKTGLDARQFDQVAVGINIKRTAANQTDFEPLILARGQFNAAGLVAVAKIASNGKYREEKIGEKTVYVFSAQETLAQYRGKTGNSMIAKVLEYVIKGLDRELALTSYDNNTLTLGSLARVREMFDAAPRLNGEVLNVIARKPNAVVNFAAKTPTGLAGILALDNDELGKNLEAIRLISGSMSVAGGNTATALSVKTVDAAQAKGLKETLDGLQILGKAALGSSKRADQQVYARMVENAKIVQAGNEITLDLQVPQADINVLIARKE